MNKSRSVKLVALDALLIPLLVASGCLSTGCAALNPTPPIEAFVNKLADEAVIPAIRSGLAQGVEQLTVQAGAQAINPTYVLRFEGKWVVGIEGMASIGIDGAAGQLQVSSSGGEETDKSPFGTVPPAEPE